MSKPYIPNDKWARRAKEEGFRARSVYKLEELDRKFHLLKSGMRVLDIGAAPGSWLQYASGRVGERGSILGLDLQPIDFVAANVRTIVCDVADTDAVGKAITNLGWQKADIILSDIAPSTSGIKDVDQWRSIELNQTVLALALLWLKPGGAVVMKVFRGADFDEFMAEVRAQFQKVRVSTVAASRDRSREVYVICR